MKKGWKVLLTVFAVLLVLLVAVMFAVTKKVYDDHFNQRITTRNGWSLFIFDGLQAEECSFRSDKGQVLAGVKYSRDEVQPRGVVVFAHGFGAGGQNGYMNMFDRLTKRGYLVFAYDATGNDGSEGDGVGGLPQGVADLDYAIRYVKLQPEYADLPIFLLGYSWGAYSVGNVLNFQPDVRAAVMLSGFDDSAEMCVTEFRKQMGEAGVLAPLFRPVVALYEQLRFGKYAGVSALSGFEKSDAPVMIVHGARDTTVPPAIGYEKFYEKYADSPRFRFVWIENRGHDIAKDSGILDQALVDEITSFFDAAL